MIRSPTPARVFDALRRHGLTLLVPGSVLAVTFIGYHDKLHKEEAHRQHVFQAEARAQVGHLRERVGSLLQEAELLRSLPLEAPAGWPGRLRAILARYPEALRAGILRPAPDGRVALLAAEAAGDRSGPPEAPPQLLRGLLPAAVGEPMASLPYPVQGRPGLQALLIVSPLPRAGNPPPGDLAFIEIVVDELLHHGFAPDEGLGGPRLAVEVLDTTDDPHPIFASPPSQAADAAAGRRLGSYVDGLPVAQRHWLVLVSPGDPRPPALLETGSGRWLVGGLLIALLAVGGHHTLQSRAAAVRRTVAEKTQALAEANEALGRYVAALAGNRLPSRRRMVTSAVWLSVPGGSESTPMVVPESVQRAACSPVWRIRGVALPTSVSAG